MRRYARLSPDLSERYDEAGKHDADGAPFVDDHGFVRWFTPADLKAKRPVGYFSPPLGHCVYEDVPDPSKPWEQPSVKPGDDVDDLSTPARLA